MQLPPPIITTLSIALLGLAPTLAGDIDTAMFPLAWECGLQDGVTLADLNDDGFLDLITGDDPGICIRLGHGDGTFGPDVSYDSEFCQGYPVTADMDGDGNLDVVTVQFCEGFPAGDTFTVSFGNGDGTIGSTATVTSGAAPNGLWGVAVADFDENDVPDVVLPHWDEGVQLHLGAGEGQFLPYQDLTPGEGSRALVVDDFDGDGHRDIASRQDFSGNVRILLGNGDGTFETGGLFATGAGLYSRMASADLDDDSDADLVVSNYGDDSVSVLPGNGDGTFLPQQQYPVSAGPFAVAIDDLDDDGTMDVVVSHRAIDAGHVISVLRGTGDGALDATETIVVASHESDAILIADVDRDGKADLVKSDYYAPTTILLNRGDGTFPGHVTSPTEIEDGFMTVDDLDGDGALDLIVTDLFLGTGIGVLLGGGDGTFVFTDYVSVEDHHSDVVVAAELGQGPYKDLASVDETSDIVRVYAGLGSGTFGPATSWAVGSVPRSLAAGDLDGDGDMDLVTGNWDSNDVSVLLQEPTGFAPEARHAPVFRPVDVALGLMDSDANLDLVVVGSTSDCVPPPACLEPYALAVHPGLGDGTFGSPLLRVVQGLPLARSLRLADFNVDGALDVAVALQEGFGYPTKVFLGVGDGTFLPPTPGPGGIVGDIDGDGVPDGVLGTLSLGNGDGTFQPRLDLAFRADGVGDFDGDGRADLAMVGWGSSSDQVWVAPNDCLNADMRLETSADDLQWRAVCGAQRYNVYRQEFDATLTDDDADGLPDEGYGECVSDLDPDPTDTMLFDPAVPLAGGGFSYLVGWVDLAGEGGLGETSAGVPREIGVPCP